MRRSVNIGIPDAFSRVFRVHRFLIYHSLNGFTLEMQNICTAITGEAMGKEIFLASRRLAAASVEKRYAGALVLDVTSKGPGPWVRFSPFYPHGDIPVPFSDGVCGASVEGIWQGLKVFESEDIDTAKFTVTTMKGLKRTSRKHGRVIGHRKGVSGADLLSYRDARWQIYLPCYQWVLENKLGNELAEMRAWLGTSSIVLLDYETNADVENLKSPLSHASLVKAYIEGNWPTLV